MRNMCSAHLSSSTKIVNSDIYRLMSSQSLTICNSSNQNVLQLEKKTIRSHVIFYYTLLWSSGIGAHLGRNRLWVRFLAMSDVYIIISHVHRAYDYLGPFGVLWVHIWLDSKIVLKIIVIIKFGDPTSFLHIRPIPHTPARELTQLFVGLVYSMPQAVSAGSFLYVQ